jgi:hypothetical protein
MPPRLLSPIRLKCATTPVLGLLILIMVAGVGCGGQSPSATGSSLKGFELYSWNENGAWHYALLPGTNRLKTRDEVRAAGVSDTDGIEAELRRIDRGQEIFWTSRDLKGMALPPEEIVQQIRSFCSRQGLELRTY